MTQTVERAAVERAGTTSTAARTFVQRDVAVGDARVAIDPRVKLAGVAVANVLMIMHVAPVVQMVAVALLSVPLFVAWKARAAVRMLACYALLCAAQWLVQMHVDALPWLHIVGLTANGVAMMMPCLVAGAAAFTTTRAGDLVCAMRRMHVPDAVVIPVVVIMRFFPTIRRDYRMIRHSMRLRGHAGDGLALLRRPVRSFECIIVPLLMNATTVANDLTLAALTKGLGTCARPTSMRTVRMRASDWAALAVLAALVCAGAAFA